MDPTNVFGEIGATEWAARLCWVLIEYKPHIEANLSDNHSFEDFCAGISNWRASCLETRQPLERTARMLYDVCLNFGLIEWMQREGIVGAPETGEPPGGAVPTRGAVRTRRAVRVRGASRQPSSSPHFIKVARLYGSRAPGSKKGA
jgi:hypothetical protein